MMETKEMPTSDVLGMAAAFDPTSPRVSIAGHQLCIMRLALQMIVAQTAFPDSFAAQVVRRTAEQALKECA